MTTQRKRIRNRFRRETLSLRRQLTPFGPILEKLPHPGAVRLESRFSRGLFAALLAGSVATSAMGAEGIIPLSKPGALIAREAAVQLGPVRTIGILPEKTATPVLSVEAVHALVPRIEVVKPPVVVAGDYYNPYGVPIDPPNEVSTIEINEDGKPLDLRRYQIPRDAFLYAPFEREQKEDGVEGLIDPRPSRLSPILEEWLRQRDPAEVVEILINLQEDQSIPLLPELAPEESREAFRETRRGHAIAALEKARAVSHRGAFERLQRYVGNEPFKHVESFWIANVISVKMSLRAAAALLESQEVMYLQPVEGGEKPPFDANPNNDTIDARSLIHSDPYYNVTPTNPWIGILDTGVRDSHIVFNWPRHIAWMRDCVNGGPDCNNAANPGYDPTDFAWNHGTSTAAIITGNDNLGGNHEGVTQILLDSWQIYTAAGLNSAAAIRGIQAGVAAFDKVLVGELQANESQNGAIATAADNAYNAGTIIVSANGNFGPGVATVRSPAIAHKVLGVGAFMTDTLAQYNNQGRGPANDGRYKPDIQAPTWSETASASSDWATQVFTGTSGAAPYGGAVAMLARNWLHQYGTVDNGQTYAMMILYGQNPWPAYNNTEGAGRLEMGLGGVAWWGKTVVGNGATIDIPIFVGPGRRKIEASLWWPESVNQAHNDVDVHIISPWGAELARGYSAVSIFERARYSGTLVPGVYRIRVRGYSVPTGAQLTYWAARVR